jgi:hypothetical protein
MEGGELATASIEFDRKTIGMYGNVKSDISVLIGMEESMKKGKSRRSVPETANNREVNNNEFHCETRQVYL